MPQATARLTAAMGLSDMRTTLTCEGSTVRDTLEDCCGMQAELWEPRPR
jgi:hypothetical protein